MLTTPKTAPASASDETAMAEALRGSGFNTGLRLHAMVAGLLRRHRGDQGLVAAELGPLLAENADLHREACKIVVAWVAEGMYGTPGGGQSTIAREGQDVHAPARRQNGSGAGQIWCAQERAEDDAPAAAPVPPGRPRGLARMQGAGRILRDCVLDRIVINGQPLRHVTPDEALGWADVKACEAATVRRVCSGLAPTVAVGEQLADAEAEHRAGAA